MERQGQIMVVEIEPLREQMTKTIGEITQVQSQIEAKKEIVKAATGAGVVGWVPWLLLRLTKWASCPRHSDGGTLWAVYRS